MLMNVNTQWQCGDRVLDLAAPVVMGVLNVTPDSFSDGGRFAERECGAARTRGSLIAEGAAHHRHRWRIDAPRRGTADLDEELERVIPVIEALRRESAVFISVDTSKPEVMRAAVAAGADIINDVRALAEPGALEAAATSGAGICLMHMQGEPRTMQDAPHYENVVAEISGFLAVANPRLPGGRRRSGTPRHRSWIRLRKNRGSQPGLAQTTCRHSKRWAFP